MSDTPLWHLLFHAAVGHRTYHALKLVAKHYDFRTAAPRFDPRSGPLHFDVFIEVSEIQNNFRLHKSEARTEAARHRILPSCLGVRQRAQGDGGEAQARLETLPHPPDPVEFLGTEVTGARRCLAIVRRWPSPCGITPGAGLLLGGGGGVWEPGTPALPRGCRVVKRSPDRVAHRVGDGHAGTSLVRARHPQCHRMWTDVKQGPD